MTPEQHADRLRLWATMYDEDGVIAGRSAPLHLRAAADEIERLRIPPGTWRVTVHPDGTVERVPMVQVVAPDRTVTWGDAPWLAAPEQGDDCG